MTLLFTLEQPINQAAGQFPQSRLCSFIIYARSTDSDAHYVALYNNYFAGTGTFPGKVWSQGAADGLPLTMVPKSDGNWHVYSQDWASILVVGKSYLVCCCYV